jgi:hypothetical protein
MPLAVNVQPLSIRDNTTFGLTPPTAINNYVLAANTPVNITVSDLEGANGLVPNYLVFAANADFYVKWNGSGAAVPSTSITDGSGVELNPSVRKIGAGITSFSIVSATSCIVQIGLFALPN